MSDVQITVDLPYPAEVVWRALTERQLVSEWFLPTDLAPVVGGLYRVFPPPGLAGFPAPFDVDVIEVVAPHRLVLRWRGEQMHTEVTWELIATDDGCRLQVAQSGFLGLQGERRRAEILEAYETLFLERLPALLARLALDAVRAPPPATTPVSPARHAAPPSAQTPWWTVSRRMRLLSIIGSIILTVLLATTLATLILTPPNAPAEVLPTERGPWRASQGPPTIGSTRSPTATPPSKATGVTAAFRTGEPYTGGYIGSITVRAGAQDLDGWTALVELPPGANVSSAWDRTSFAGNGSKVTFTPQEPHRRLAAGTEFTFSFQVNNAETPPTSCTVNGVPCTGLAG